MDYKDKSHRYYVYKRINTKLPVDNRGAWGKCIYPKGTTTLIGDTLEKNGLLTWPMGMALQELFGFYNFVGEDGVRRKGFSKQEKVDEETGSIIKCDTPKGTMWQMINGEPKTISLNEEDALPVIISAQENHNRRKKKGADIGSVVHDAIEHYVTLNKNRENEWGELEPLIPSAFDIGEQYIWAIKDAEYEYEADFVHALEDFEEDAKQANKAYEAFQQWWDTTRPVLYGAEDLLYSLKHNVCGTYDGDIGIKAEFHPMFQDMGQKLIRVTADWKTSKASKSEMAAMPQGVGYTYFIQSAIYEIMRREMGKPPADDLLIVSCRKDGGFTLIYASELGFTVGDCIAWAEAVILCQKMMVKAKIGLWEHYYEDTPDARPIPKERKKKAVQKSKLSDVDKAE